MKAPDGSKRPGKKTRKPKKKSTEEQERLPFERGPRVGESAGWGVFYAHERETEKAPTGREVQLSLPDAGADAAAVATRLERARQVAQLHHAGLVEVLDVGPTERPYIAEAMVVGPSLDDLLAEQTWFQPRDALAVVAQLATALDFAHARRLFHGAVETHAVLIEEQSGRVKLTGLTVPPEARPPSRGRAPEDLAGDGLDRRADLFGLGTLLYELLTGMPAFAGASADELKARILEGRPIPVERLRPALPSAVTDIVHRLLARDPHARFPTGNALAEAIERVIPEVPELRDTPPERSDADRTARRRRARLLLVLAVGIAVLLVALALGYRMTSETPAPAPPAQTPSDDESAAAPPADAGSEDVDAAIEPGAGRAEAPAIDEREHVPPQEGPTTTVTGTTEPEPTEPDPPAVVTAPPGEDGPIGDPLDSTANRAAWVAAADEINRMECSRVETEPGRYRRRIVGVVPDEQAADRVQQRLGELADIRDTALRVRPLPETYCAVLGLLGRLTVVADRQLVELLPSRMEPLLAHGDILALSGRSPAYPAFLTIDYLGADGTVTRFDDDEAIDAMMPAGRPFRIGHPLDGPWYEVAPPFGDALVVAIAWHSRPDIADRPGVEPIEEYLPALEEALKNETSSDPILASVVALRTRSRTEDPSINSKVE